MKVNVMQRETVMTTPLLRWLDTAFQKLTGNMFDIFKLRSSSNVFQFTIDLVPNSPVL